MKVVFVAYHPAYCTKEECLSINVGQMEVIPRKGDIVKLNDFLPEDAVGITADLIRDGGDWTVDYVIHSKGLITIEF